MIDYIERTNLPTSLGSLSEDQKASLERDNGIFKIVNEYFSAEKGDGNPSDLQNVLKKKIQVDAKDRGYSSPTPHSPGSSQTGSERQACEVLL